MSESRKRHDSDRALLVDAVRCSGCRACVKACMEIHGFAGDPQQVRELSATAYTALVEQKDGTNLRMLCRHCVEPSCASVCPVAALHKTPEGPVVYDGSRCIGCRYCMMACPFNVPRYEWHEAVPSVRKCDLCHDRQRAGKPPACAEACMYEATVSGTRAECLAEARKRIAESPDEYRDHVFGEDEVGGTSVLFLVPKSFEAIAALVRAGIGDQPLPDLTGRVLSKLPGVAVGGAATLLAFWWITRRRDEVAGWEKAMKGAMQGAAEGAAKAAARGVPPPAAPGEGGVR